MQMLALDEDLFHEGLNAHPDDGQWRLPTQSCLSKDQLRSPRMAGLLGPILTSSDLIVGRQGPSYQKRASLTSPGSTSSDSSNLEERMAVKWEALSKKLITITCRTHENTRTSKKIPEDVHAFYDELQVKYGISFEPSSRRLYYCEFYKAAFGYDLLHRTDVEYLIQSTLGFNLSTSEIKMKTSHFTESCHDPAVAKDGVFSFESYACLLADILRSLELKDCDSDTANFESPIKTIFPLDPDMQAKQVWDFVCSLLLLYCAFSVPYSIAFVPTEPGVSPIDISDIVIDCVFMIDIALSFITAYDNQGFIVREMRAIARTYLRTWFWPDLAGSFPFDIVLVNALASSGTISSGGLSALKFIRMLRLIRAWKFLNRLKKLKDRDGFEAFGSLVTLGSALFLLIFFAHLLGCLFTVMASSEPDYNWLVHYSPDIAQADQWVRYLCAMYWATITVTTMGYGDIVPVTDMERAYLVLVALAGAVIFSHCLGTISSLISQVAGVDDRFQAKARAVQEYLQFRDVPAELRRRVMSYYHHCWKRSAELYEERGILNDLKHGLRVEILKSVGKNLLVELPVLAGFGLECAGWLATRLRRTAFNEGEELYEHGAEAAEMYFVVAGAVKIFAEPAPPRRASRESCSADYQRVYVEAGEGDTFGELGLFPDVYGAVRTDRAVAASWGWGYALSATDMPELEARHPGAAERLRELCAIKSLHKRMASSATTVDGPDIRRRDSAPPCPLQMRCERLKAELLHRREAELLVPLTGEVCPDILPLLRRAPAGSAGSSRSLLGRAAPAGAELQSVSCVLSERGELLCVEHSLAGIAAGRATSLGLLRPGGGGLRVLGREELARFGGGGRRRIFGLALRLLPPEAEPCGSRLAGGLRRPSVTEEAGREVELFTWSPEVRNEEISYSSLIVAEHLSWWRLIRVICYIFGHFIRFSALLGEVYQCSKIAAALIFVIAVSQVFARLNRSARLLLATAGSCVVLTKSCSALVGGLDESSGAMMRDAATGEARSVGLLEANLNSTPRPLSMHPGLEPVIDVDCDTELSPKSQTLTTVLGSTEVGELRKKLAMALERVERAGRREDSLLRCMAALNAPTALVSTPAARRNGAV